MLFEYVLKILDKSRENKDEIFVARDKIIAEEGISFKEIKPAYQFIVDYYDTITKCRRLGDNDTIKALVEADDKGRKEIIKEVADRVEE